MVEMYRGSMQDQHPPCACELHECSSPETPSSCRKVQYMSRKHWQRAGLHSRGLISPDTTC